MPFGLCNVAATFELLVERLTEGLYWKTTIDDVTVFCQNFQEELERLSYVFTQFRATHLKLSPKKRSLFQK